MWWNKNSLFWQWHQRRWVILCLKCSVFEVLSWKIAEESGLKFIVALLWGWLSSIRTYLWKACHMEARIMISSIHLHKLRSESSHGVALPHSTPVSQDFRQVFHQFTLSPAVRILNNVWTITANIRMLCRCSVFQSILILFLVFFMFYL